MNMKQTLSSLIKIQIRDKFVINLAPDTIYSNAALWQNSISHGANLMGTKNHKKGWEIDRILENPGNRTRQKL